MKKQIIKLLTNILLFGILILISVVAGFLGLLCLYLSVIYEQSINDTGLLIFFGIAFIFTGCIGFYITNGLRLLVKS